jgi:hypothetical protein
MLRRIFGPKRDEVKVEWRRLHNKELHALYTPGDHVKDTKMGRTRSTYGERRVPYRVLVGKSDGMRPLRRPRRTWADIIKRDIRDFGCEGID